MNNNNNNTRMFSIMLIAAVLIVVAVVASLQLQHQQAKAQTSSFITYQDPRGKFSIDHPPNWTVKAATNRFDTNIVTVSTGYLFPNYASLSVSTSPEIGSRVEDAMPLSISTLEQTIPGFELNQDVECQKYTIDGHKACSIIFAANKSYIDSTRVASMQVAAQFNHKMYIMTYVAFPDSFDKYLPIVDKIISSFKLGTGNPTPAP